LVIGAVVSCSLAMAWLACVGSDPSSSGTTGEPGDYHAACKPDHTCKPGLKCQEDICLGGGEEVLADGAVVDGNTSGSSSGGSSGASSSGTGSSSGGSSSGGSSSGSSGVDSGCNPTFRGGNATYCRGSASFCFPPEGCCVQDDGGGSCVNGPCSSNTSFGCDDPTSCPGEVCCIVGYADAGATTTMCERMVTPTGSHCASGACGSGQLLVCETAGAACADGSKCKPVEVLIPGAVSPEVWLACVH